MNRLDRWREAKPVRDALIAKHGRCMVCHGRPGGFRSHLCCHEIARGPNRDKALDKPFAILVLCNQCHIDRVHGNNWTEAKQLSVLKREAPEDYDLEAYNRLVNPRAPQRITEEEVDLAFGR